MSDNVQTDFMLKIKKVGKLIILLSTSDVDLQQYLLYYRFYILYV